MQHKPAELRFHNSALPRAGADKETFAAGKASKQHALVERRFG
jgi:hypothetical protein